MAKEAVKTRTDTSLQYPQRFHVIVYNDDYTPMEFVIKMLVEVFNKNIQTAKQITLDIHNNDSAIAGTYNLEIADQKCTEAITIARTNGHPLQLKTQPVE